MLNRCLFNAPPSVYSIILKSLCIRQFSISCSLNGKRNFRKFIIPNRGTEEFKKRQKTNPDPRIKVYDYGVKQPGFKVGGKFVTVPEMIPEIIVPDLTGFKLKPYVSYRVEDVHQTEFSARDLFSAVYAEKIVSDFKAGKLAEDGSPLEPSENESLAPEEAQLRARQTGSDIFVEPSKREKEESYLKPY